MAQQKKILITGGAGYIGAVVAYELVQQGYQVIIVDRRTIPTALQNIPQIIAARCDYADVVDMGALLREHAVSAVIHLAAYIEVGESVENPARYYDNNVTRLLTFLELLRAYNVSTIIAASSGAVYGIPQSLPITEEHPCEPVNPYGCTKRILEWILQDYGTAYGMRFGILRYSNVAGGYPEVGLCESHDPETHLIPRLILAVQKNLPFTIRGIDYPTADGTGVRDFVHVRDVAQANYMMLRYLEDSQNKSCIVNVSSGVGSSVRDVIGMITEHMQKKLEITTAPCRAGDPAALILSPDKARLVLNWVPIMSELRVIIQAACG